MRMKEDRMARDADQRGPDGEGHMMMRMSEDRMARDADERGPMAGDADERGPVGEGLRLKEDRILRVAI